MKIEKKALLAALEMAGRFAGKVQVPTHKDPVEIIRLIFTTDTLVRDILVIQAWDNMSGISLTVPFVGLIEEERAYHLPAAALIGAVSRVDDETITLIFEKTGLTIKSQSGKSTLRDTEADAALFPPEVKTSPLGLTCCQLKAAIDQVSFAAYPKFDRENINGVRFEFAAKELILVATDGVRLAKYVAKTSFEENLAVTAPLESVVRLSQTLAKLDVPESPVEIGMENGRMAIHWNGGYLFFLLSQSNFPDYRVFLPKTCKTKLTFGVELFRAIKTARVIAREACTPAIPVVHLRVNGEASIETEVEDVGKSTISLNPQIEGCNEVQVGFNVNLLPLAQIADGAVMGVNASNLPVLLKNADPNWLCVLMPVIS